MIISINPVGPSWLRRAFIILACTGLAALLASFLNYPAPQPSNVVVQTALSGQREIDRPPSTHVLGQAPITREAPRRMAEAAHTVTLPTLQPPKFPFRFLGKVDVGGETSVVLYGRGRTLTVRAAGPLDDEYGVDAIEEGYLVLRHLPSGMSHMLDLASRQRPINPVGSAAEAAQD